jgi:hypothetical protein
MNGKMRSKMAHKDMKSSILIFVIGCGICFYAIRTGIGMITRPGPGFFAFLTGVALSLFPLMTLLRTIWNPSMAIETEEPTYRWRNVLLMAATIVGYSLGLEVLGYLAATLIFTILLFCVIQRQKWWIVLLGGTATTLISYLLFHVWLKVELPIGYWRF